MLGGAYDKLCQFSCTDRHVKFKPANNRTECGGYNIFCFESCLRLILGGDIETFYNYGFGYLSHLCPKDRIAMFFQQYGDI